MSMDARLHSLINAAVNRAKKVGASIAVVTEYDNPDGTCSLSLMGTEGLLRQVAGDLVDQGTSEGTGKKGGAG